MNFDPTEAQALLKAAVERHARAAHGLDMARRRQQRACPGGFDRAGWTRLAELGVTALPFAEADCGLGGGPVETILVAEALGAALATEPFTECLVPAAHLFAAVPDGQRAEFISPVIAGDRLPALAILEAAGRYNLAHVETRARLADGGWRLSGAKAAVWQGMAADWLIVTARESGGTRDAAGIGLFLVAADAAGVERRAWRAADGQLACELVLRDAPASAIDGAGLPDVVAAVRAAWLAASAEMLGLAGLLFETTLAHVKARHQFGQPIGRFQVIQHRMADAYVSLEQARSMVYRAALAAPGDQARAIDATFAFVGEAARAIAHEAVQLHGGMGVTDELLVGHGLKRIQLLSRLWGEPALAARRYAEAA